MPTQEFTPGPEYARLYRRRYIAALVGIMAGVIAILLLFNSSSGDTGDTGNKVYGVVTVGVICAMLFRRVCRWCGCSSP